MEPWFAEGLQVARRGLPSALSLSCPPCRSLGSMGAGLHVMNY